MKPISEIIVEKHVKRMRRARNGERYIEEKTFLMKYNPTTKAAIQRVLAKIIDLVCINLLCFWVVFSLNSDFNYKIGIISFALFLLINPILEAKTGKTIGKFIFGIQVINDFGSYPNLKLSYKRNLFSLFSVYIALLATPRKEPFKQPYKSNQPYRKDYHNHICNTWVIADADKAGVLKLVNDN